MSLRLSSSADGTDPRTVVVQPITAGAERQLLYRDWVESNRAYVEKVSGGRLGYVHIHDMSEGALRQLAFDLDADNRNKAGVVVDVRHNGGFVNVYAIDVLARRGYLTMTPRGLPASPARTSLGQRSLELPTILVTNQHSLSDAEDFTEGYRLLKLGQGRGRADVRLDHLHRQRDADRRHVDPHAQHAHHLQRRQDDGARIPGPWMCQSRGLLGRRISAGTASSTRPCRSC